jgi:cyclic nucleotide-binding protein
VGRELVGASPFPRHWLYDSEGKLAGKSALVDFKTWYRTAAPANSPWGNREVAVPSVEAESALERQLSLMIMRAGGKPPKPKRVRAGTAVMNQGDEADDLVLVLDGVMAVEVDRQAVAQVGPGSLLGERSRLESGRRTASVRAVTDCRLIEVDPGALAEEDLRALAAGHRREAPPGTG